MRYIELANVYERLEKTAGKLDKTDMLAKLFEKTEPSLLPKVVLLAQGRVFPDYEQTELGVSTKLALRAIAKAAGVATPVVEKKFKQCGDLGLTVEHFASHKNQRTLSHKSLTVEMVFNGLQSVPQQAGHGSQERKLAIIAELVAAAEPKEALYIIRTVLQELRIGIAEGIVRDAIAKAFGVSAEDVEHAWNIKSDFGEIAAIARTKGAAGLKKIRIEIGKPIQVLLAEKAPGLEEALESFERPSLETKYDGMRAQIHRSGNDVWIFTRRLENVTQQFPDIVAMIRKNTKSENFIIEGEVLGIDPKTGEPVPFQLLSQRVRRKYGIEEMARSLPAQLNLFDIVYLDGGMLFNEPLHRRRAMLEKIVQPDRGKLQLSRQMVTKDPKKADDFYRQALDAKQEGVMVKNLDALYVPGRSVAGGWLKVKPTMENLDLVIVGATWGTGKRAGALSSFVLGCRDPDSGRVRECGMMGTGIKEKKEAEGDVTFTELTNLLRPYTQPAGKAGAVVIKPKIVVEVAYEEIQKSPTYSSGFALRFPRFVRLRPEKGLQEADTLERIKRLYEMQKGKRKAA